MSTNHDNPKRFSTMVNVNNVEKNMKREKKLDL